MSGLRNRKLSRHMAPWRAQALHDVTIVFALLKVLKQVARLEVKVLGQGRVGAEGRGQRVRVEQRGSGRSDEDDGQV